MGILIPFHISWEEKEKYPYNIYNTSETGSPHRQVLRATGQAS